MSALDSRGAADDELRGVLRFATLEEAEACLRKLDDLWRSYMAEDQRGPAQRVLELARLGRRRAEMIAKNKRVSPARRAEKEEIRQWFRIWLENPDVFFDWLGLRKQSPEFQEKFGGSAPAESKPEAEEAG